LGLQSLLFGKLANRIETTQVSTSHELEDLFGLALHGTGLDLAEEGGQLYLIDFLVLVEVESD
jgi:hypothetical protein